MDIQKVALMKQKIEEAELVLIGIGEEWEIKNAVFEKNLNFIKAVEVFGEESPMIPFVKKILIDELADEGILLKDQAYRQLADLIKEKNYFLVSLCEDGLITKTELNPERIVEPCGTLRKLQCSDGCDTKLYDVDRTWLTEIKDWLHKDKTDMVESILEKLPVCPKCGKPLVFNTILADNYLEEGYLPNWQIYRKWLQGTVNRNVCILELGVGMKYPTVIRWPFEKVAFFNQKASFFRVHSKLYQTAEEIKEKSHGIQATPEDFFRELST